MPSATGWPGLLGLMVVVLLLWELVVRLLHVPASALPAPSAILLGIRGDWRRLLAAAGATALPAGLGLVAGVGLGLLVARGLALGRRGRAVAGAGLALLRIVPMVALAPLLLIEFGYGLASNALLVGLLAFVPGVVAAHAAFGAASAGGAWRGAVLDGLRDAAPAAVAAEVVAEFAAPGRGLGTMLLEAAANVDATAGLAAVFVVSGLALAFHGAVWALEGLLPGRRPCARHVRGT